MWQITVCFLEGKNTCGKATMLCSGGWRTPCPAKLRDPHPETIRTEIHRSPMLGFARQIHTDKKMTDSVCFNEFVLIAMR